MLSNLIYEFCSKFPYDSKFYTKWIFSVSVLLDHYEFIKNKEEENVDAGVTKSLLTVNEADFVCCCAAVC